MATKIISMTYQLKRGTESAIEAKNPILVSGEPIVIFCSNNVTKIKVGNGSNNANRSNAFEVYSDGTAKLGGEQVATQQYVNNYSVQIQIDEQTGALYRIYDEEMEWISPPFHDWREVETTPLNNEIKISPSYRTIERHNGYPVYVRRIELRDMPLDSEQTITWESMERDEPNPVIISYSGIMHGLDNGHTAQNIDSISSIVFGEGMNRALLTITINNSHFDVQSNDFGYIDIKYIKQ